MVFKELLYAQMDPPPKPIKPTDPKPEDEEDLKP